ncbi:Integrator complex subunit 7, partial [Massospora cicadina]
MWGRRGMDRFGKGSTHGLTPNRGGRSSPKPPAGATDPKKSTPYPPLGLVGGETDTSEPPSSAGAKRLMQLEAQLRLDRQAAQLRAIAEFGPLFDAHPTPVLVNSGLLKLADLFCGLGNGARMVICQTFHHARPHLKLLLNKDQVVARIAGVANSNDYLARSLCLRTLATLSEQICDRLEMHYLILRGLEAEEELELAAALEFAAVMVGYSQTFASTLLPKLHAMLARGCHPRVELRVTATLETFCRHVDLAQPARQLCLRHLSRAAGRTELKLALLETSTALAVADAAVALDQVDRLFRHLHAHPTAPSGPCALRCLVRMAKAGLPIEPARLPELVQLGPAFTVGVLMVLKFSRLQLDLDALSQLPPLPEPDQLLAWHQTSPAGAPPLPSISAEGLLGYLLAQLCLDGPPAFTRTLLAAQILTANAKSTSSKHLLKLVALRLWVTLARLRCPHRLRALLSTLAIVMSRFMAFEPTSRFDQQIIMATLKLHLGAEPSPLTKVIGRWVLVYCDTFLMPSPEADGLLLDDFVGAPELLATGVCVRLHVLPAREEHLTQLLRLVPIDVRERPDYAAALSAIALCALRTSHYRLAAEILPELRARASFHLGAFLLGLQVWGEAEAELAAHVRAAGASPDPAWIATFSELPRNFYRAATCFQAWAASKPDSSPFPVWWLQTRAESLAAIRTLLSILIRMPARPTPFQLVQLGKLLAVLGKLRQKLGFLSLRFYGLDKVTRDAIRDRRLLLALLAFAIHRSFKLDVADPFPELLSVQAMEGSSQIRKSRACRMALEVTRGLQTRSAPEAVYLWQVAHQMLAEASPSPPALFTPWEAVSIKLTMDPCPSVKPMPIQLNTRGCPLSPYQAPPSRLRLTLSATSEPIMDLPFNLDVQLASPLEPTAGAWVTEVTASLPASFHQQPYPQYLSVSCAVFNPHQNVYLAYPFAFGACHGLSDWALMRSWGGNLDPP